MFLCLISSSLEMGYKVGFFKEPSLYNFLINYNEIKLANRSTFSNQPPKVLLVWPRPLRYFCVTVCNSIPFHDVILTLLPKIVIKYLDWFPLGWAP